MSVVTEHRYRGYAACLNPALFDAKGETEISIYAPLESGQQQWQQTPFLQTMIYGFEESILRWVENKIDDLLDAEARSD